MSAIVPAPARTDERTASRLLDRLALAATIVIFCVAIGVLLRQFASVSPGDVLVRLAAMPRHQVLAALALTIANYLCLTGYDFLALRYVRRRLRFRDVMFASFTAFAVSNTVGFQLLSGGSIRYRLYSRCGLDAAAIGSIVAFCTVAYALGVVTVGGVLALAEPGEFAALLQLPQGAIVAAGIVLLSASVGYILVAAAWRRPLRLGRFALRPPAPALALAQVALACLDAVLAGTVMYVLLPADVAIGFAQFLGVYAIAATASVLSLVPGGLGVFETAIILLTVPTGKAAMLGVFLVYRMIYFIAPLVIAVIVFSRHQLSRPPR